MKCHQIQDVVPRYTEEPGGLSLSDLRVAQKVKYEGLSGSSGNVLRRTKRRDQTFR